jgi:hypothetical protein
MFYPTFLSYFDLIYQMDGLNQEQLVEMYIFPIFFTAQNLMSAKKKRNPMKNGEERRDTRHQLIEISNSIDRRVILNQIKKFRDLFELKKYFF